MSVKPKLRPVFSRFEEIDTEKPYKLTCPEMSLLALRFKTLEMAMDKFNEAKENKLQAILTYVDLKKEKLSFIKFSSPD